MERSQVDFADFSLPRLFAHFAIHEQARCYWKHPAYEGIKMLTSGLPAAIGCWDSEDDAGSTGTGA